MILKLNKNRAVAAPEFPDLKTTLEKYNGWEEKGDEGFYAFLVSDTPKREVFLRTLNKETVVHETGVVRQKYV